MGSRLKAYAVPRLTIAQDGRCGYCLAILTPPCPTGSSPTDRTLDHMIPRGLGGPDRISNLTLACVSCNRTKGTSLPLDFIVRRLDATSHRGEADHAG